MTSSSSVRFEKNLSRSNRSKCRFVFHPHEILLLGVFQTKLSWIFPDVAMRFKGLACSRGSTPMPLGDVRDDLVLFCSPRYAAGGFIQEFISNSYLDDLAVIVLSCVASRTLIAEGSPSSYSAEDATKNVERRLEIISMSCKSLRGWVSFWIRSHST